MKIKDTYTYNFPAYAMSALFNGDTSGIEQEDIDHLDAFLKREDYIDDWDYDPEEDSFFVHNPEFGLACDCITLTGIVWE